MRIPKLPCRGKICLLVSMSRVGVVLRNLSLKLSTSLKKVNISSATSFNHSNREIFFENEIFDEKLALGIPQENIFLCLK